MTVKKNPQGHSLCLFIKCSDGKRTLKSCPMQADRPMHRQEHQSASQREMLVVKAMVRDTVESLCQPRTETIVSKTCSRFCHRIIFPLQALTYKAHGTEAIITPSLSLPSLCIFSEVDGMRKTMEIQTWAPSSCTSNLLWELPNQLFQVLEYEGWSASKDRTSFYSSKDSEIKEDLGEVG